MTKPTYLWITSCDGCGEPVCIDDDPEDDALLAVTVILCEDCKKRSGRSPDGNG